MKQNNTLEINPFYSETTGELNREQTLTIDTFELEPEKKRKPEPEVLKQLQYIKKVRKENKLNCPIEPYRTFELSVGTLLQDKKRGSNRNLQIQEIIKIIREMQKERNYTDISREFLMDLLNNFTNLKERTKQRILLEILNKSKSVKERVITRKYLVNIYNYEKKLKEEKTITPKLPVEKRWVSRNNIETFYSFV